MDVIRLNDNEDFTGAAIPSTQSRTFNWTHNIPVDGVFEGQFIYGVNLRVGFQEMHDNVLILKSFHSRPAIRMGETFGPLTQRLTPWEIDPFTPFVKGLQLADNPRIELDAEYAFENASGQSPSSTDIRLYWNIEIYFAEQSNLPISDIFG